MIKAAIATDCAEMSKILFSRRSFCCKTTKVFQLKVKAGLRIKGLLQPAISAYPDVNASAWF